jgi:pSer/pThr/pTyr-binding forkhead associated (FHA) protein
MELGETNPDATKHSMELFREACGGGPLELNIEYMGRQDTTYRVLYHPHALIGRDPRSDLVLDHADVNLRHAYLQRLAGRIYCVDLDSRHGTHWESGRKKSGWLDYDRAVRVGPYWIRPDRVIQGHADVPPDEKDWPPLPNVTFEFLNSKQASRIWKMVPILALVGKSEECRVRLVAPSVSTFHCSLVRTPYGVWVVDLLGRGGIWVNDALVRCIRLDEDDQLQVGSFLMRVHYDNAPQLQSLPPPSSEKPPEASTIEVKKQSDTKSLMLPVPLPPTAPASQESLPVLGPNTFGGAEGLEAMMVPLAKHLGQMQQQMFDQFQQGMMMMFQMFNTLHRDQVGVIREELEHLHRLTEEVKNIQADLMARGQPAKAPSPPAQAKPAAVKQPQRFPAIPLPPQQTLGAAVEATNGPAPPVNGGAQAPLEHPDTQMHVWLTQRLANIQQERQSHWQKIVNFLTRKP